MYTVDLYLRVRLACHVDGLSQREAASRFGIARETVRKMLRHSEPPGYRRRQPPKRPKLAPFTDIIDRILGDVPAPKGAGVSKSAVSRRFVALSAERMKRWMAADLSNLDLLIIQIDGIHIDEDLMLLAAVGIDGNGDKHPLGVIEGATENTAVVQALLDNLVGRGLDPAVCRLFIIDGAKALSKAIRNTFGRHTPIQRCQVHKARNITERLARPLHASVRKALRQAWELDDADKAERLIKNLARRLEHDAPGVSASILERPRRFCWWSILPPAPSNACPRARHAPCSGSNRA